MTKGRLVVLATRRIPKWLRGASRGARAFARGTVRVHNAIGRAEGAADFVNHARLMSWRSRRHLGNSPLQRAKKLTSLARSQARHSRRLASLHSQADRRTSVAKVGAEATLLAALLHRPRRKKKKQAI